MATIEALSASHELPEPERRFGTVEDDFLAYSGLAELMRAGKHGERWHVRDFDDDRYGLLHIDKAYMGVVANGMRRMEPVDSFGSLLISAKSRDELDVSLRAIFSSADVSEHRKKGGMVIFVPVPHTTNADLPVSAGVAGQNLEIALNQTVLMHRQVPLGEFRYTEEGQQKKLKIVDDGILLYSGILQTFPDSASGRDDRFATFRDVANRFAMEEFIHLKNKGSQVVWDAVSASELADDGTVGRASQGSAKLLYKYNKLERATGTYNNQVMTIPYVIDINPFTPEGATDVPFEFMKPVFLHSEEEVHAMMEDAVKLANRIRRPTTPNLHYETSEEHATRLST